MYIVDIIFIFVLAVILSYVFVGPIGWRRREAEQAWAAVLFVFPVLFFAFWAANLWIAPIGPVYWGVAFFPVVIVGLVLILLIAAAAPPRARNTPVVETTENSKTAAPDVALGFFFWLVLLLLIGAIVAAYWAD